MNSCFSKLISSVYLSASHILPNPQLEVDSERPRPVLSFSLNIAENFVDMNKVF